MNFRRFLVAVSPTWEVTITLEGVVVGAPRQLAREQNHERWWPLAPGPVVADAAPQLDAMFEIMQRLRRREPLENDVGRYGRYLFDVLLGERLWLAVEEAAGEARAIELALRFSPGPANEDLSRHGWEALRSPRLFLAAGYIGRAGFVRVAISRVVPVERAAAPRIELPPRVLYVVGSSLTDRRITAGAEFFGVVRTAHHAGSPRRMVPRVLVNATVRQIQTTVAEFRPDIVHIVCHGTEDGRLEFFPEPQTGSLAAPPPVFLDAPRLAELFRLPDANAVTWTPSIVILSTCYSAGDGSFDHDSSQLAPLAAELVRAGVPIVVGMTGRVADTTCRVFSQNFVSALSVGWPLMVALEVSRRAAFQHGELPETNCDWMRPCLFLAEKGVPPDFVATSREVQGTEKEMTALVQNFMGNRTTEPCFAVWHEELERCHADLRSREKNFLMVRGDQGAGRSRILAELAGLAARDGDLPVFISAYFRTQKPAKTLEELLKLVHGALANSASWFHARAYTDQLGQLDRLMYVKEGDYKDEYAPDVRNAMGPQLRLTLLSIIRALRHDLRRLEAAVRAVPNTNFRPTGRVVLIWDELEALGPDVLLEAFGGAVAVIGPNGFVPTGEPPIPLVLGLRASSDTQAVWEEVFRNLTAGWASDFLLSPWILESREHTVPYQQVLLHPHNPTLEPEYSDRRWVIRKGATPTEVREAVEHLERMVTKLPRDFNERGFYWWVMNKVGTGFLVTANDEELMKRLHAT